MKGARELKRRIKGVKNIEHITRAMKMVAASKFKRAQNRLLMLKPFTEKMEALLVDLSGELANIEHPYLKKEELKRLGLVVVTGDKGLCGAYNSNVLSYAQKFLKRYEDKKIRMITIGTKATSFFRRRGYDIYASFPNSSPDPAFSEIKTIVEAITSLFETGGCEEVHMIYTHFVNTLVCRVEEKQLLPLSFHVEDRIRKKEGSFHEEGQLSEDARIKSRESISGKADRERLETHDFIFEPGRKEVVEALLPRYLRTRIYVSIIEAITSEHSARMVMMGNATDKAEEMIAELTLHLNKARQEMITRELIDIVGGVEALKGSRT